MELIVKVSRKKQTFHTRLHIAELFGRNLWDLFDANLFSRKERWQLFWQVSTQKKNKYLIKVSAEYKSLIYLTGSERREKKLSQEKMF